MEICTKVFDYIMRDQFGYNHALQDKLFMTKDRDKFQRVIVKAAAMIIIHSHMEVVGSYT